jgi:UDP-N-acetylmuramoyl-tripeptide--D-alanyl-D-alanine ligase
MLSWDAQRVARSAGADLLAAPSDSGGPERVSIDSREAGPGVLFVGLAGEHVHGGIYAREALAAGAWGVLTDPGHASDALRAGEADAVPGDGGDAVTGDGGDAVTGYGAGDRAGGAVLSAPDPLRALQSLATAWRRELGDAGAQVIAVTGSTGKTSTKDILAAVLGPHRSTVASRANFNTEIGLPLELLTAPAGTEVLVLEMGMRGPGQIAELVRIAEPDVGVIVSIGPVHLELLGSLEAIAAAKAELIAGLAAGSTAVVPAHEPLLEPHLRADLITVGFGPGGEVVLVSETDGSVEIDDRGARISLSVDFTQAHLRRNLLAAVAAARAVGVTPAGAVALALSPGRGQRVELTDGVTLIDDSYNANPMSMRAALDELSCASANPLDRPRRRVAVLGDMLELGPGALDFHREVGAHAAERADVLITVGPLAAAMAETFPGPSRRAADAAEATQVVRGLLRAGDVVLVKASNGVQLRQVCEALAPA